MKVTCKVCNTTKNIKEEKLAPYRGKTISTKCANKQCTHRVKFKVPLQTQEAKSTSPKPKEQKGAQTNISKPTNKAIKKLACPNCKAEITASTKFCAECGHKIVKQSEVPKPKAVKCIKCGRSFKEGEKFCLECGTAKGVKPSAHTPKQQPQQTFAKAPEQKKKKKGAWNVIWKVLLTLVVLGAMAVAALYLLGDYNSIELANGPWEVKGKSYLKLYDKYDSKIGNREKAIASADKEYSWTLSGSSIDLPVSVDYGSPEDLLFDQYNPVKKGKFRVFTIKDESIDEGEVKVIIELKSETYFEGKAFYYSEDLIELAYIKGNLKL